jgi:nogalonic acid methyl ester cyclase/aklanonic acid methyl ester cyclase
MSSQDSNIKAVERAIDGLNTGDVSDASQYIHPDYFNHESQADPRRAKLRGPAEYTDTVQKLRSAFSGLHYEIQERISSGDTVVLIVTVSGKHTGDFFGIAPSGRDFSYRAVHIMRLADGKIVEHRAVRDDLSFMMQLGVIGPASPQYEPIFNAWKGMMKRAPEAS